MSNHALHIQGSMKCLQTGEETPLDHYLFRSGATLAVCVLVTDVTAYPHEEDSSEFQININCLALDCFGSVFPVGACYTSVPEREADAMRARILPGTIFWATGEFGYTRDREIMLSDAEFEPVPEDIMEHITKAIECNYR